MKTATLDFYHVFGTRTTYGIMIKYRGKILFSQLGADAQLKSLAKEVAKQKGFTHYSLWNDITHKIENSGKL